MRSEDDELRGSLQNDRAEGRGLHLLQEFVAALSFAVEAIQTARPSDLNQGVDFYEEVRQFEKALIKRALKATKGNQSRAARLLNLNQTTLHGKIKYYRLSPVVLVYDEHDSLINLASHDNREIVTE